MTTAAGERDKRVSFQRGAAVRGGLGAEPVTTWSDLGRRWAAVRWGTGAERREAGAKGASQSATFIVLADSITRDVRPKDRILFDGRAWDVHDRALIERAEIHFTATAAEAA